MSQNLSAAAVVIGALRVNHFYQITRKVKYVQTKYRNYIVLLNMIGKFRSSNGMFYSKMYRLNMPCMFLQNTIEYTADLYFYCTCFSNATSDWITAEVCNIISCTVGNSVTSFITSGFVGLHAAFCIFQALN